MMVRFWLNTLALVAIASIAACGGRSPSNTIPRVVDSPHASAHAQIVLKVPRAGTSVTRRGRKYISPATQAIQINKQTFDVSPTSPGCAQDATALSCAFDVDAPNLGQCVFTVSTFDAPLAADGSVQGNLLSTGATTAMIQAGVANVVKVTAFGFPAQVTIDIANLTPPAGVTETTPVHFDVRDADGYAIVGPYSSPIVLSVGGQDARGLSWIVNGTPWSTNTGIAQPTDVVALHYSGHEVTGATVTATVDSNPVYTANFTPTPAFGVETPIAIASLAGADLEATPGNGGTAVWFTEPTKGKLARIAPNSTRVREIPLPSGGTAFHLSGASYGGDEVLVSEKNSGYYADVSVVNGVSNVTETALPGGSKDSYEIAEIRAVPESFVATEPGGKLAYWHWDNSTHELVATELSTGVANSSPAGIVLGSGGYFFADTKANGVGFLDFNGSITYYPLPSPGAAPTRIAARDESSTFAVIEPGASKVAFFSDPHTIREYSCSGVPVNVVMGQFRTLVLNGNGNIDVFDPRTGERSTFVAPASAAGPVVAIASRFEGDLMLLHSNASSSSLQDFFYN